jgi:hypothetical protein
LTTQSGNGPITKIFLPARLALGLGICLLGDALLVYAFFFADRISIRLLLFGALLAASGIGVALSSKAEACAACKKALEQTSTSLPIEHEAAVVAAVQAAEQQNLESLVAVCNAPFPATHAPLRAAILVHYCPQCRKVAQFSSSKQKLLPDGATTDHDISPPAVVVSPNVARVLDAVGARNQAWSLAMYSGVT